MEPLYGFLPMAFVVVQQRCCFPCSSWRSVCRVYILLSLEVFLTVLVTPLASSVPSWCFCFMMWSFGSIYSLGELTIEFHISPLYLLDMYLLPSVKLCTLVLGGEQLYPLLLRYQFEYLSFFQVLVCLRPLHFNQILLSFNIRCVVVSDFHGQFSLDSFFSFFFFLTSFLNSLFFLSSRIFYERFFCLGSYVCRPCKVAFNLWLNQFAFIQQVLRSLQI